MAAYLGNAEECGVFRGHEDIVVVVEVIPPWMHEHSEAVDVSQQAHVLGHLGIQDQSQA